MPTTRVSRAAVIDGLRRWARGAYAEEAAVELLVRSFGGRFCSTGYPLGPAAATGRAGSGWTGSR